jgi:hypothetical protein
VLPSPYHFAYVHAGIGELDAAIDWLEHAFERRSGAMYGIKGSLSLQKPARSSPIRISYATNEPGLGAAAIKPNSKLHLPTDPAG